MRIADSKGVVRYLPILILFLSFWLPLDLYSQSVCHEVTRSLANRVGIIGVPSDIGGRLPGSRQGPQTMRNQGLIERLESHGAEVKDFGDIRVSDPSSLFPGNARAKYADEIIRMNNDLALGVREIHEQGYKPLVLGGDHSMLMGSVWGSRAHQMRSRDGKGILGVYFDAHSDIHTPETTETGNVHGMPVAHLFGLWRPEGLTTSALFERAIDPKNFHFIGLRDVDAGEEAALKNLKPHIWTIEKIREIGIRPIMEQIIDQARRNDLRIHASFDLDWMDPEEAPGVGIRVPNGGTYEESRKALRMLNESGLLYSLDIVELSPPYDLNNITADTAIDMATFSFGR